MWKFWMLAEVYLCWISFISTVLFCTFNNASASLCWLICQQNCFKTLKPFGCHSNYSSHWRQRRCRSRWCQEPQLSCGSISLSRTSRKKYWVWLCNLIHPPPPCSLWSLMTLLITFNSSIGLNCMWNKDIQTFLLNPIFGVICLIHWKSLLRIPRNIIKKNPKKSTDK